MKKTQQQDAGQVVRPNLAHSAAGPQQATPKPTSEHRHPFAALSSNSARSNASVQRMATVGNNSARVGTASAQRKAIAENGLPGPLKSGIEALSGMSMDHVKVYLNSPEPGRINAHAYTQGSNIHVAPGQEKHLAHEAWHVVQQAQGRVRPTVQMKSGVQVNDEGYLEAEADAMGAKAMSVSTTGASVQRAASEKGGHQENPVLQKMMQAGSVIQCFWAEGEEVKNVDEIHGDPTEMGYELAGYKVLRGSKWVDVYKLAPYVFHSSSSSSSSSASPISVPIFNRSALSVRPVSSALSLPEVTSAPAAFHRSSFSSLFPASSTNVPIFTRPVRPAGPVSSALSPPQVTGTPAAFPSPSSSSAAPAAPAKRSESKRPAQPTRLMSGSLSQPTGTSTPAVPHSSSSSSCSARSIRFKYSPSAPLKNKKEPFRPGWVRDASTMLTESNNLAGKDKKHVGHKIPRSFLLHFHEFCKKVIADGQCPPTLKKMFRAKWGSRNVFAYMPSNLRVETGDPQEESKDEDEKLEFHGIDSPRSAVLQDAYDQLKEKKSFGFKDVEDVLGRFVEAERIGDEDREEKKLGKKEQLLASEETGQSLDVEETAPALDDDET